MTWMLQPCIGRGRGLSLGKVPRSRSGNSRVPLSRTSSRCTLSSNARVLNTLNSRIISSSRKTSSTLSKCYSSTLSSTTKRTSSRTPLHRLPARSPSSPFARRFRPRQAPRDRFRRLRRPLGEAKSNPSSSNLQQNPGRSPRRKPRSFSPPGGPTGPEGRSLTRSRLAAPTPRCRTTFSRVIRGRVDRRPRRSLGVLSVEGPRAVSGEGIGGQGARAPSPVGAGVAPGARGEAGAGAGMGGIAPRCTASGSSTSAGTART